MLPFVLCALKKDSTLLLEPLYSYIRVSRSAPNLIDVKHNVINSFTTIMPSHGTKTLLHI